MSEWKEYKVSEVINDISMGPFGSYIKRDCYVDTGVPYLNGSNLCSVKLNEDGFNYVTEEKAKSLGRCIAKRGDIIVTHRGTIGQISYIPFDSKYELYLTGNSQFRLTVNSNMIRPDFFVYFFHTRTGLFRLLSNASQVGVPALARPTSSFKELQIPVPPMEAQNKVMDILHALDDKIAVNKKICENLEAQAQALFKHWFVDFTPFKDGNFCANREQNETCFNSAEVQPKITGKACKFVESELGLIPEGWRMGTLGDIAELRKPSIKPQDNILYTHYSIPAFDNNKKPSIDEGSTIKSNKFGINDGAVLLSKLNPSTKRIWYIGNVPDNSVSSTEFLPFYSKNKEFTPFVYCYLNCDSNYREIAIGAKGTTNSHQRIDANSILTRGLAYSEEAIKDFCDCCQYLMELILEANQESFRLASLRDTLLPKLMSGQIEVNEIEKSL